jgi:hypothetical protein
MKKQLLIDFLLLIIISTVLSCTKKQDSVYYVNLDSPGTQTLDEFIRSVQLIPLETTDESLIKNITKVIFYDNLYYVKDIYEGLFVFDTTGHFIRKIGSKGSGPGEYGYISDFCINVYTSNLELLGPRGDLMIFNPDGKYLNTIMYRSIEVSNFLLVDDDLILFSHQSQAPVLSLYSRSQEKIIKSYFEIPENFERRRPFFLISPPFYITGDDTVIHYGYTNDLYTFRNLSMEKRCSFDFGRHNFNFEDYVWSLDYDKNYYIELLWSKKSVAIGFNNHFENDRFIIKQIYYQKGSGLVLIDKKEKRDYFIQGFKDLYSSGSDVTSMATISPAVESGTRLALILNWDSGADYILTSVDPAKKELYINPLLLDSANLTRFTNLKITDNPMLVKIKFKD